MLELAGLSSAAGRRVGGFSLGMRRLLAETSVAELVARAGTDAVLVRDREEDRGDVAVPSRVRRPPGQCPRVRRQIALGTQEFRPGRCRHRPSV